MDAIIRECRDAPEGEAAAPVPAPTHRGHRETIVPAEEEAVATPTFDEAAALGAALEERISSTCRRRSSPPWAAATSLRAQRRFDARAPLSPQPTNAL